MQTGDASGASGASKEEYIKTIISEVLRKLPEEDLKFIPKQNEEGEDLPLTPNQVVLTQELERFNILVRRMAVT